MLMPKPAYQNTTSEAFWVILIYAEHNEVRANRVDARLVSQEELHNWNELPMSQERWGKDTQVLAHDVGAEAEIQWLHGWTVKRTTPFVVHYEKIRIHLCEKGDQQPQDTFISAKKRTFAHKSDSITIFTF